MAIRVILICGFPASGKSFYVKGMLSRYKNPFVINTDELRLHLLHKWYDKSKENMIWDIAHALFDIYVERHRTVIIDATNLTKWAREKWISVAKKLNIPIECHWVKINEQEARKRNSGKNVGTERIEHFIAEFEPPRKAEGFSKIKVVAQKDIKGWERK